MTLITIKGTNVMSKSSSNNFIKHGSILAAASILSRILGLLYRIPLTAIIGDTANGLYGYAFEVYSIALILSSYSMPLAVSKLLSARFAKGEYLNGYRIFKFSMIFSLASGFLAALLIFILAPFIEKASHYEGLTVPLRILAPTIFLVAVAGTLRGFFQSHKTMIPTAVSQLIEQVVNAIVSIGAAAGLVSISTTALSKTSNGAAGSTLGTLAGALVSVLLLLGLYLLYKPRFVKMLKSDHTKHKISNNEIKKLLLATIIPVILSQAVYQASGVIDGSLFGNLYDGEDINLMYGLYSSKYRVLINVPNAIASAMASSMIPVLVTLWSVEYYKEFRSKLAASVKTNMIIAIPCAMGLAVLGSPIMRLLFPTTDYVLSGAMLSWGAIAVVFYSLSTVTNAALQGMDKMNRPVIHSAISLAVHILLVVVLLKFSNMGVYALVIGNVTFPLLVCILNWIAVAKTAKYTQELRTTFIIPTIASAVMGVLCLGVNKLFELIPGNHYFVTVISVLICIVIAIPIYFVVIFLLKGLTVEDLHDFPMGGRIARVAKKFRLLK